jgi:streptogramin lyase
MLLFALIPVFSAAGEREFDQSLHFKQVKIPSTPVERRSETGIPNGMPSAAADFPVYMEKFNTGFSAIPLNLVVDSQGRIWFSDASSGTTTNVLGKLDPATRMLNIYYDLVGVRRIHFIAADASDRIWYITSYASGGDVVGVYDPSANEFTEWGSDQFIGLYGLDVDQTSGDIWFTGTEPTPKIFRFSPGSGDLLTSWPISGYEDSYDLSIDAAGDIWITDIPILNGISSNSTVLQLKPDLVPGPDQLVKWPLPSLNQAPFKLDTSKPDEVWFSEYFTQTNSLARLDLITHMYEQYQIPTAGSYPAGLAASQNRVWLNASGEAYLGLLSLPATPDVQTSLTPVAENIDSSHLILTSTVYTSTNFEKTNYTASLSTQLVAGLQSDPFSEYPTGISTTCSPDGPWAFGLIPSHEGGFWFSGCNALGRIRSIENPIFLPLIIK